MKENDSEGYRCFEILGPKVLEKNLLLGSALGRSCGAQYDQEWPGSGPGQLCTSWGFAVWPRPASESYSQETSYLGRLLVTHRTQQRKHMRHR